MTEGPRSELPINPEAVAGLESLSLGNTATLKARSLEGLQECFIRRHFAARNLVDGTRSLLQNWVGQSPYPDYRGPVKACMKLFPELLPADGPTSMPWPFTYIRSKVVIDYKTNRQYNYWYPGGEEELTIALGSVAQYERLELGYQEGVRDQLHHTGIWEEDLSVLAGFARVINVVADQARSYQRIFEKPEGQTSLKIYLEPASSRIALL